MDAAEWEKSLQQAMTIIHNAPLLLAYVDTALISAYNKNTVVMNSADRSRYLKSAYRTK